MQAISQNLGQKSRSALSGAAAGTDLKKRPQVVQEFADEGAVRDQGRLPGRRRLHVEDRGRRGNLKPGQTPDPATLAKLQKLATSIDSRS